MVCGEINLQRGLPLGSMLMEHGKCQPGMQSLPVCSELDSGS